MEFPKSTLPTASAVGRAPLVPGLVIAALVALGMGLSGCCSGVMCRGMDEAGIGIVLSPGHSVIDGMRLDGTTAPCGLQLLGGRRFYGGMPWIDLATTALLIVMAFCAGHEWRRAAQSEVEID